LQSFLRKYDSNGGKSRANVRVSYIVVPLAMLVFICVQVVQTNNNETMNPLEEKGKKQPLSIENKHETCNLTNK
jgi:hypothetical protein